MSLDWVKKRKKTTDDEEAKLNDALLEFQAEFGQASSAAQPKTFLRGSVVEGNKTVNSSSQGNVYAPKISMNISKTSNLSSKDFDEAKKLAAAKARRMLEDAVKNKNVKVVPKVVAPPTQHLKRPPKPGSLKAKNDKPKVSVLETFKLELQKVQEDREKRKDFRTHLESSGINPTVVERLAPEQGFRGGGEFDNDPYTTNIYVCNIPHSVTEEDLLFTFGSFGPLAALKILYPRCEEERRRPHICAFVAFMSRIDTDRFLNEARIVVVRNEPIRSSLARPVTIPPTPYYIPPQLVQLQCPDPISGLPFNAQPNKEDAKQFIEKYKSFPPLNSIPTPEHPAYEDYMNMIRNAVIRVVIPPSRAPLRLINRTAIYVITEGAHFEAMICAHEYQNPLFQFLWDNTSACHVYYRWRIYSLLQGDSLTNWRKEKFRMFENGSWWIPPLSTNDLNLSMPECLYDTTCVRIHPDRWCQVKGGGERRGGESRQLLKEIERKKRQEMAEQVKKEKEQRKMKMSLSERKRDKLEKLIREITPEQNVIGEAMVWCVENAMNAKEICECIYESLTIDETPLHKKIARLYLISDILSNCVLRGVRDVFLFRKHFEELLEKIFEAIGSTHKSIGSRIKQEQFKQRVMNVFRHWEETTLYPVDKLIHCQNVFLGLVNLKKSIDENEDDDEEDFTENMNRSSKKQEEDYDDDLDGIPIGPDGEVAEGNLEDDEDIDGIPMETSKNESESDEEEGRRFENRFAQNFKPVESTPASKWESAKIDDIDLNIRKSPERRRERSLSPGEIKEEIDTSKISLFSSSINIEDEKRRRLMRDVEVRAMVLLEDLEADGDPNAKQKVDDFRKKEMENVEKLMKEKGSSPKSERKKEKKDREKSAKKEKKRSRSRSRDRDRDRRDRERDRDRDRDRRSHRDRFDFNPRKI